MSTLIHLKHVHVKKNAHICFLVCEILALARDPPLSVVRKFVHLLEQSALDLHEEQEVTRLREEVVTNIRSNQQMEKDLNEMDIKIGLLVKNRITLQVVISKLKVISQVKILMRN